MNNGVIKIWIAVEKSTV